MRYSKMFGKTRKSSKEFDSVNATLLIKGGFIDQTMAGVYTFLPLGLRVLNKIENIVREEMNEISSEMLMPALAPKELWEVTNRINTIDVLFKASGVNDLSKEKNPSEYVLNSTHEEVVTPIAKSFNYSYKDLPFSVYQIQTKYRNEARPKAGLLRGREFRMKDLYSFHPDVDSLKDYYEVVRESYFKIFERLGLKEFTYYAAASGGDFTEDFSHEFQVKCDSGEDLIFYSKEDGIAFNKEVAPCLAPESEVHEQEKPLQEVFGENIVGVDDLCKFLNITPQKTTKTLIYDSDVGVLVASVRGDYDVNEDKLKKSAHAKWVKLAKEETIKEVTGAEVGYAGILNLPTDKGLKIFIDESIKYLKNFETGANKTNYHITNINWYRDIQPPEIFYDIKMAKEGDLYPETGKPYETFKGSEAGNIFPLNVKFSTAFNYYYADETGQQKIVYMGSYGFGTSRVMGILVEKFHDGKGIIWPENVAPFKVHLIGLNLDDEQVETKANKIYKQLVGAGIEVLFDDRKEIAAGEKFSDADLIGIPYRMVVSKKTGEKIELKKRSEEKVDLVSFEECLNLVKK
ncbi:proline--tRNA ligase [candidate division WWE3 bacterium]|uniref:Proline--tRNA ligase n=1 Tax=candidate division WWE3 bacterium TaxID=2053526 RepID=A0A7X9HGG9_UNCKA|nr:proline--tRNA ligase [candidate division WWE3 bacterium]